jgi:hypothetical protein
MDVYVTDKAVEALTQQLVKETREMLTKNDDFLLEVSKLLYIQGNLSSHTIAKIAEKYQITLTVKEENYMYISNYEAMLNGRTGK